MNSPALVPLIRKTRLSSVLLRSKAGSEMSSAASERMLSMTREIQIDVIDSMKLGDAVSQLQGLNFAEGTDLEYTAGIFICRKT